MTDEEIRRYAEVRVRVDPDHRVMMRSEENSPFDVSVVTCYFDLFGKICYTTLRIDKYAFETEVQLDSMLNHMHRNMRRVINDEVHNIINA